MEKSNQICFRVYGKIALFSDPLTRVGGEKCSYLVPTYQALKGICESIYWKPTFIWVVDCVRIVKPIKTQSKGIRPIKYNGGNDLSIYNYLSDVEYEVKAHFIWNKNREDLKEDRNENKHFFIAKRMIEKGGRRDIFLGTRECQAYVEPCAFGERIGAYDTTEHLSFGVMVHGLNYPDETGENKLKVRLFSPEMKKGIIDFITPEECTIIRDVKQYEAKSFVIGKNFSTCDELYKEEGGL